MNRDIFYEIYTKVLIEINVQAQNLFLNENRNNCINFDKIVFFFSWEMPPNPLKFMSGIANQIKKNT